MSSSPAPTGEALFALFSSLSDEEKGKFLSLVHTAQEQPLQHSPSSPALASHEQGHDLHSRTISKKHIVIPMSYLAEIPREAVIEAARKDKKLKKWKGMIEPIDGGGYEIPFDEIDREGSHSRVFRLFPRKGTIAYVNPKTGDKDEFHIKALTKMKQLQEKEWKIVFDGVRRFKPVFETESASFQFGYLLRFMKAFAADPTSDGKDMDVSIFIGSWNVGNAPPDVDFNHWIPKDKYDIYVIGAQECEYKPRPQYESCEEDWRKTITAHIGDKYQLLQRSNMWQIRLLVFIRHDLRPYITNIARSKEATGIARVAGNKGGVAIGFDFLDSSLCFVNSHLAAHQIMVQQRNDDVAEIIQNLKIGPRHDVTSDFQYAFWCGDLNYRIEGTKDGVQKLIREKQLDICFSNDQLQNEMKKQRVFYGFTEGKISFRPTYKFDRGTRDEYAEELGRVPSWCDRILVCAWEGSPIQQLAYNAAFELMTSDHSPVFATYKAQILRPFIPDSSPKPTLIGIYDLFARDLPSKDANGYSDPFVKFKGSFLKRSMKTSTVTKSLNPNWVGEIVVLQPLFSDEAYLQRQFIEAYVWDYDSAKKNDILGMGTISLKTLSTAPSPFELRLRHNGKPRGVLYGKMILVNDVPEEILAPLAKSKSKK